MLVRRYAGAAGDKAVAGGTRCGVPIESSVPQLRNIVQGLLCRRDAVIPARPVSILIRAISVVIRAIRTVTSLRHRGDQLDSIAHVATSPLNARCKWTKSRT